jgi:hypothetical protein
VRATERPSERRKTTASPFGVSAKSLGCPFRNPRVAVYWRRKSLLISRGDDVADDDVEADDRAAGAWAWQDAASRKVAGSRALRIETPG